MKNHNKVSIDCVQFTRASKTPIIIAFYPRCIYLEGGHLNEICGFSRNIFHSVLIWQMFEKTMLGGAVKCGFSDRFFTLVWFFIPSFFSALPYEGCHTRLLYFHLWANSAGLAKPVKLTRTSPCFFSLYIYYYYRRWRTSTIARSRRRSDLWMFT